MKSAPWLAVSSCLLFLANAHAQKTTIEGQLIGGNGRPLAHAEIRIQSNDEKIGGWGVRTNEGGIFSAKMLPPSIYQVTIRVDGNDVFVANHIRTSVGDPWRIDYNVQHAVVTMSTAKSKKVRRFAWQSTRTGSQLGGRWVETTSSDGYEPEPDRVEGTNVTQVLREMQKSHPGTAAGGR